MVSGVMIYLICLSTSQELFVTRPHKMILKCDITLQPQKLASTSNHISPLNYKLELGSSTVPGDFEPVF